MGCVGRRDEVCREECRDEMCRGGEYRAKGIELSHKEQETRSTSGPHLM